MLEIVWQYAPGRPSDSAPQTTADALQRLDRGNLLYAEFTAQAQAGETAGQQLVPLSLRDLGVPEGGAEFPDQEPFAAFLGCADARVPLETVFGIRANGAFVVRVAGNVLGSECLGSLEFAVATFPGLRLLAILGHTGCGAVTAAVDAFLQPTSYLQIAPTLPLRAIVDSLVVPVRAAAAALQIVHGSAVEEEPGYRTAVIELASPLNAALTARIVADHFSVAANPNLDVAFAVFNLQNRRAGLPGEHKRWQGGLFAAPADQAAFRQLGRTLASSPYIRDCLLKAVP